MKATSPATTTPVATITAATAKGQRSTLSLTVTRKDEVAVFPAESVAVQVTVVFPTPKVAPEGGEQLTNGEGSTRSVAVTWYVTTAPVGPVASAVRSAGTVNDGRVVSWTVTVKDALAVLPEESAAVQATVVVPRRKTEPEAGEQTGVRGPSRPSSAVTT